MKPQTKLARKTNMAEVIFAIALVVLLLVILPQFGATAMVVGSAFGLAAQVFLFRDRFRSRSGSLTAAICLVAAFAIAAVVVLALTLIQGDGH